MVLRSCPTRGIPSLELPIWVVYHKRIDVTLWGISRPRVDGCLLYKPTFFLVKSHVFKAHPFQVQFLFPATLQPVGIDMVVSNTVIVDRSPQAADPSLNRTTNTRSPDIQELLNEDNPQTRKIYYFQNCGTVYMPVDSFNARGVRMENCGNNVPQVNCSLFIFSFSFLMI